MNTSVSFSNHPQAKGNKCIVIYACSDKKKKKNVVSPIANRAEWDTFLAEVVVDKLS